MEKNDKYLKDYEKGVENSIREENDNLIGKITTNIKEFKLLNNEMNVKINSTTDLTDKMNNKFSKSTGGLKGNMSHLITVVKNKQGNVCWFIVLIFVIVFFIRRYLINSQEVNKNINNSDF